MLLKQNSSPYFNLKTLNIEPNQSECAAIWTVTPADKMNLPIDVNSNVRPSSSEQSQLV
jgi:hypothetical protein